MGFWDGTVAVLGAVPGIISLCWQIRKSKPRLDIKVAYEYAFMSDDYKTISSDSRDGSSKKRTDVVARITNLSDFDVILDYACLSVNEEILKREDIYVLDIQHEEGRIGSMSRVIERTYPVKLSPGEWYIFDDFDVTAEELNKHQSFTFGVKITTRGRLFESPIDDDVIANPTPDK